MLFLACKVLWCCLFRAIQIYCLFHGFKIFQLCIQVLFCLVLTMCQIALSKIFGWHSRRQTLNHDAYGYGLVLIFLISHCKSYASVCISFQTWVPYDCVIFLILQGIFECLFCKLKMVRFLCFS